MTYKFSVENPGANLGELLPLYTLHYEEMSERLRRDGFNPSPFNPAIDRYIELHKLGAMMNYVVRTESGEAVGYCNMYVTTDMHNQDKIAREDTVFIRKDHRNGVGAKLVKIVRHDLTKNHGCKRIWISPVTDLRVGKIWERMGFRPVAQLMVYEERD